MPLNKTNKNDFDIIVATEWRTVYRIMDFDAYKMYFVQDFEPIFFEMGERYLLSKKTYELGLHIVSLGKWNVDTVVKSCDVKGQIDYIEFPYEKTEYTFVKRNFEKIKERTTRCPSRYNSFNKYSNSSKLPSSSLTRNSGCHCKPIMRCSSIDSIASMVWSLGSIAVTRKLGAKSLML